MSISQPGFRRTGAAKVGLQCEYMKQSCFLYYYLFIMIFFFPMDNGTPTFAHALQVLSGTPQAQTPAHPLRASGTHHPQPCRSPCCPRGKARCSFAMPVLFSSICSPWGFVTGVVVSSLMHSEPYCDDHVSSTCS